MKIQIVKKESAAAKRGKRVSRVVMLKGEPKLIEVCHRDWGVLVTTARYHQVPIDDVIAFFLGGKALPPPQRAWRRDPQIEAGPVRGTVYHQKADGDHRTQAAFMAIQDSVQLSTADFEIARKYYVAEWILTEEAEDECRQTPRWWEVPMPEPEADADTYRDSFQKRNEDDDDDDPAESWGK